MIVCKERQATRIDAACFSGRVIPAKAGIYYLINYKVNRVSELKFKTLALHKALLTNLESLDYHNMTPIQAKSLPFILEGKDVIAKAKTGSGKTAAFGLALLNKLNMKNSVTQALVLCPTRELADQVAKEIRRLARGIPNIKVTTLCGGQPFGPQIGSLEHAPHIIVGTPGRVEKHLHKGTLVLNALATFVLDEADRMLDMGFEDSVDAIVAKLPKERQTLLFSATYPKTIRSMANRIMDKPAMVEADVGHDNDTIKQSFYLLDKKTSRDTALRLLLLAHQPASALVFCNTKIQTEEVADMLKQHGFSAMAINGDFEQKQRTLALAQFANKSVSVLVATDVAARGLDIDKIDAVINYHVAHDPEVHVHRVGRTGRAGSLGAAYSLYSGKESHKLHVLAEYLKQPIENASLPANSALKQTPAKAAMVTLQIDSGKKEKIRAGDILGALTGDAGIAGAEVGKIQVFDYWSCVAVAFDVSKKALEKLQSGKIKGRVCRVRLLRS
jgi:ATP-dependent RNA helicase DbpA